MSERTLRLSIVIALRNGTPDVVPWIKELGKQCDDDVEIILAHQEGDELAADVLRCNPRIIGVATPIGWLVPQLWGVGISRSTGPWVAITTAGCVPETHWYSTASDLAKPGLSGGVGGPIAPPPGGSSFDWALYFARYSAYMPSITAGPVDEIPGDNAVYSRDVIDRFWDHRESGFWEPLVHRRMRAAGAGLSMDPRLVVHLAPNRVIRAEIADRLRHGRHFASTRPGSSVARAARFLSAPALVPVLYQRLAGRVLARRPDLRWKLVASTPWLIVVLAGWSLGEAWGYLRPETATK